MTSPPQWLTDEIKKNSQQRLRERGIDFPNDIGSGQDKVRDKVIDKNIPKPPKEPDTPPIPPGGELDDWGNIWTLNYVLVPISGRVCAAEADFWYSAMVLASGCKRIVSSSYTPFITDYQYSYAFLKFYTDYSTDMFAYFNDLKKLDGAIIFLNGECARSQPYTLKDGDFKCTYFKFTCKTRSGHPLLNLSSYNMLEFGLGRGSNGLHIPSDFMLIIPRAQYTKWNWDFKDNDKDNDHGPGGGGGPSGPGGGGGPSGPGGGGPGGPNNTDNLSPFDHEKNRGAEGPSGFRDNLGYDDFGNPPQHNDLSPYDTGLVTGNNTGYKNMIYDNEYNDVNHYPTDEESGISNNLNDTPLSDSGVDEDAARSTPTSEITLIMEGIHDLKVGDHIIYSGDPLRRRFIITRVEHVYDGGRMTTKISGSIDGEISTLSSHISGLFKFYTNIR